jgi:hypothetical protein
MPFSRLALVFVVASCALFGAAAPITASSGAPKIVPTGIRILVAGNCPDYRDNLATAIAAHSNPHGLLVGVTAFDTSVDTPAVDQHDDLLVSLGDFCGGYHDSAAWGNELADFVDHGGAVLQAAYDNWDTAKAHPTGRFASGGYAPLSLGPAANQATTLGTVLQPNSPIVQGLGTFATADNTTTALAPGATLLAKWADGRNAIAIKGFVVATSASADDPADIQDLAQLAFNTAVHFRFHAAPDTIITRARINSRRHLASFRFTGIGGASFRCRLNKAGTIARYTRCYSPVRYAHLAVGAYVFEVRAIGRRLGDPSPAKKSFRIRR